jgi:hypothetical protein
MMVKQVNSENWVIFHSHYFSQIESDRGVRFVRANSGKSNKEDNTDDALAAIREICRSVSLFPPLGTKKPAAFT